MNLFSIFRSSSAEILLSKRFVAIICGLLAVVVLAQMTAAYVEFIGAYVQLHQFDTPIDYFISISIFLLLPFWGIGALLFRACLQRLRLEIWLRKALRVVNYGTPLSPAEAGFLVDYQYTHRELAATLLDLHFRRIIALSVDSAITITVLQDPSLDAQLSPGEQTLLSTLRDMQTGRFASFLDPRLTALAMPAHEMLLSNLTVRHMIRRERLPRPALRQFFRVLYIISGAIAAFVSVIYIYAFTYQRQQMLTIGYPRYSVASSELTTLILIGIIVGSIIISGFWPRFARNYKDPHYEAWIDAAGFKLFIGTVFKNRFTASNIATQDQDTLRTYVPYAVAYGIIPDSVDRIRHILSITG